MAIFTLKQCFIKSCNNTNVNSMKIFITVPGDDRRYRWINTSGIDISLFNNDTQYFCCEDHFDLRKDALNWETYRKTQTIFLKKNVVPHRHLDQQNPVKTNTARRIGEPVPSTSHHEDLQESDIPDLTNGTQNGKNLRSRFVESTKQFSLKTRSKKRRANSVRGRPTARALPVVHSCIVPVCGNTSMNCEKHFLWIRLGDGNGIEILHEWEDVLQVEIKPRFGQFIHCCEDHFNLETDIIEWHRFKTEGGLLRLKQGVLPSKFLKYPNPDVISKITSALLSPSDTRKSSSSRHSLPKGKKRILKRSLSPHAADKASIMSCLPTIRGSNATHKTPSQDFCNIRQQISTNNSEKERTETSFDESDDVQFILEMRHQYSQCEMASIHKSTSTEDLESETECDCDAHS